MKTKVRSGAAEALAGLRDGMRIMAGGFGLSGNAEHCIAEIARRGVKDLTIISNNVGSSRVDLQACKLEYSIVSPK